MMSGGFVVFSELYIYRGPAMSVKDWKKNIAIDFIAFGECVTYYGKQFFMGDIE